MCERCHGAGVYTKPEGPPDEHGYYTKSHVLLWYEFMRRLGNVVRLYRCRCQRRNS